MKRHQEVLNRNLNHVFNLPNVVGVGIGYKVRGGEITKEHAIVALVAKKLAKEYLPKSGLIPAEIEGLTTDVREVGELRLLANTAKVRPAQPGYSIGHYKITAGTFGAVVYDAQTREPLILSNNHVLANVTNGTDGNSKIGDPIYQPGKYDGGTEQDTIAHLHRFVPVYYGLFAKTNKVDCAAAKPISDDMITNEILGIGKVNGTAEAAVDMNIKNSGRTTELTEGTIDTVSTTVRVNMGDGRYAKFADQFVAGATSKGGDSGSLVLDENNAAVGLLFAGSDTTTVMCRIQNVLEELDVTF